MNIIQSKANPSGSRPPVQSWGGTEPPEGYLQVPDGVDSSAMQECGGFVTLTVEDGVLTAITGDKEAYQAYLDSLPEPEEPEPTREDRLRADLDFLAAMEGVEL